MAALPFSSKPYPAMLQRRALLTVVIALLCARMTRCTPSADSAADAENTASITEALDPALLERAQELTQRYIIGKILGGNALRV